MPATKIKMCANKKSSANSGSIQLPFTICLRSDVCANEKIVQNEYESITNKRVFILKI